jgi:hypothetical protein
MIYSVWDADSQLYDYYKVGEAHNDDGPTPRPRGGCQIGYAPNEASWKLPTSAVKVGRGDVAKGAVVHLAPKGGLALSGIEELATNPLVLIGLGAVGFYLLRRR